MNDDRGSGASVALALALPLVAVVLMSSFNRVTASRVANVRLDLVFIGLAACASAGIGLWMIGIVADRLGFVASGLLGLADVGLMVAAASVLKSISNGETASGGAGLAQTMVIAVVFGVVAFLIRWGREAGSADGGGESRRTPQA